jgi:hypothetical protein
VLRGFETLLLYSRTAKPAVTIASSSLLTFLVTENGVHLKAFPVL